MTDWPAIVARYLTDPCALSCAAMPTPSELVGWTMETANGLLVHRIDQTPLFINRVPALVFLAALPPGQIVGSLAEVVELASEDRAAWPGVVRLALADAVDFVLRQSFNKLHRLRFQRLRADNATRRRKQDCLHLAHASGRVGDANRPARATPLRDDCSVQPSLNN